MSDSDPVARLAVRCGHVTPHASVTSRRTPRRARRRQEDRAVRRQGRRRRRVVVNGPAASRAGEPTPTLHADVTSRASAPPAPARTRVSADAPPSTDDHSTSEARCAPRREWSGCISARPDGRRPPGAISSSAAASCARRGTQKVASAGHDGRGSAARAAEHRTRHSGTRRRALVPAGKSLRGSPRSPSVTTATTRVAAAERAAQAWRHTDGLVVGMRRDHQHGSGRRLEPRLRMGQRRIHRRRAISRHAPGRGAIAPQTGHARVRAGRAAGSGSTPAKPRGARDTPSHGPHRADRRGTVDWVRGALLAHRRDVLRLVQLEDLLGAAALVLPSSVCTEIRMLPSRIFALVLLGLVLRNAGRRARRWRPPAAAPTAAPLSTAMIGPAAMNGPMPESRARRCRPTSPPRHRGCRRWSHRS